MKIVACGQVAKSIANLGNEGSKACELNPRGGPHKHDENPRRRQASEPFLATVHHFE